MKLPNGDKAEIPIQKLIGYCLNLEHRRGQHKARKFASVLGITQSNANILVELVKQAAVEGKIVQKKETPFGEEFKVDWTVPNSDVQLRSIWEIAKDNPNPRLISVFIK